MLQDVLNGSFALSAQGRMAEDRASRFGISLEHPDIFILVNSKVKADFAKQMVMLGLQRLGQPDGGCFRPLQHFIRSGAEYAAQGLLRCEQGPPFFKWVVTLPLPAFLAPMPTTTH